MSRANAALSLPPGDRDDAPVPAPREAVPPPGSDLILAGVGDALEACVSSLADVRLARQHEALPVLEALARKHAALAKVFAGEITAARLRLAAVTRGPA